MITLAERICSKCHRVKPVLNNDGLCKDCAASIHLKMKCFECNHNWENPTFAYVCPICGSTVVGLLSDGLDDWLWQKIAHQCNIRYVGMQQDNGDRNAFPLFETFVDNAPQIFTKQENETLTDAIERTRAKFATAQ